MVADVLIPYSVRAYVHDGAIRRAVNEILGMPDRSILEGLSWSELDRFYRAKLAARQLESEWGVFALEAWEAIWGGLLDQWTALTPDEQMRGDYEAGLDLTSLKETDDESLWFGRLFRRGGYMLYANLSAVPMVGLRLKISCEASSRAVRFLELASSADEFGNWTPLQALPLDVETLDVAPLRELASRAVAMAEAGSAARSRS